MTDVLNPVSARVQLKLRQTVIAQVSSIVHVLTLRHQSPAISVIMISRVLVSSTRAFSVRFFGKGVLFPESYLV